MIVEFYLTFLSIVLLLVFQLGNIREQKLLREELEETQKFLETMKKTNDENFTKTNENFDVLTKKINHELVKREVLRAEMGSSIQKISTDISKVKKLITRNENTKRQYTDS